MPLIFDIVMMFSISAPLVAATLATISFAAKVRITAIVPVIGSIPLAWQLHNQYIG